MEGAECTAVQQAQRGQVLTINREEDVEGAFFLLEEVVDVLFEVGGDLVQGGEGRRSFIGLEEGDEF